LIVQAIEQTKSVPQAAALLGFHHSTLYRKLKKYKIDLPLSPNKEESRAAFPVPSSQRLTP